MARQFVHGYNRKENPDMSNMFKPRMGFAPFQTKYVNPNLVYKKDQGNQGSCTGHGVSAVAEAAIRLHLGIPLTQPLSPAFIYALARMVEGTLKQDSGASVDDAMTVLTKQGICWESFMPYSDKSFKKAPNKKALKDALSKLFPVKMAVDPAHLVEALSAGHVIAFGMDVFSSFMDTPASGLMPKPAGALEGGHCTALYGYDLELDAGWGGKGCALDWNSWGPDWANKGNCSIPLSWLQNKNHCSEFYTVQFLTNP